MLSIATSNKACGGKEQGFAQENTTSIDEVQKCSSVEILLCKFTNEAKARELTLSFLEQADTFAFGEQIIYFLSTMNFFK